MRFVVPVPSPTVRGRLTAIFLSAFVLLFSLQPALATSIQTDLWVYNNGDTVTVSGDGFGPDEIVDIVTSDPNGVVVDSGTAPADADGNMTYGFTLNATVGGIYDVVATGESSGLTASTQFDPPPNPPTNLTYLDRRASGQGVTLTWVLSNQSTDCYQIYRSTSAMSARLSVQGNFSCGTYGTSTGALATASDPTNTYVDATATSASTNYHYFITGLKQGSNQGESVSSNQVAVGSLNTSPASKDFGTVATSATSTPQTFTVTNNGDAAITFRSVTKSGSFPGDFTVSGTPAAGTSVAIAASFTFSVTFTPGAVGSRSANLQVNASDPSGSATVFNGRVVPVSGAGVASDGTAPVGSITINNGNAFTNSTSVSLGLQATDAVGVTAYRVANGSDCSGASFVSVTSTTSLDSTIAHTLTAGDGVKTVCAQFRDAAGNVSATATDTITVDTGIPSAPVISSPANNSYNNTGDVTVSGTAEANSMVELFDGATSKGNTSADGAGTWSKALTGVGNGLHTYTAKATDAATNTSAASNAVNVTVDKVAPTITFVSRTDANAFGWNNTNVTVTWDCADALSGPVALSVSVIKSAEGADESATGTCQDLAGNSASNTQTDINIDKTAPTGVHGTASRVPDHNGWYNHAFGVAFDGTDPLSGIDSCDSSSYSGPETATADIVGNCSDKAGNSSSVHFAFKYDATAPSAALAVSAGTAGTNGWYTSDVTISTSGADTISDPVSCTADQSQTTETTGATFNGSCTNDAGLSTPAAPLTVMLDTTAPMVDPDSVTDTTWRNSDRSETFTSSDTVSGLADAGDATFSITASLESTSGLDPTVASHTVSDLAGNSTTRSVSALIDLHAPVIVDHGPTATANGTNGWYKNAVTNQFTATDGLSGLANAGDASFTRSSGLAEGAIVHISSGPVGDQAGNINSGLSSAAFKIDFSAPTITFVSRTAANGAGWNNTDVTVTWSCSDTISGVVAVSVSDILSSEGAGQTAHGTCTDGAGNTVTDAVSGINIDKTAPTAALSVIAGAPGANGWYTSNVTVHASGSDSISSPVTCTSDQLQIGETTGETFNGSCTNAAGLTTNAAPLTVKLDKTAPSAALSVSAGTLGANGWYTSNVAVHASGSDSISSPVTCTADQFQTGETTGMAFGGSCTNNAGLATNASSLTVKLDKTAPMTPTFVGIQAVLYPNGSVPTLGGISCLSSDSISPPANCTFTGYGTALGTHTLVATAVNSAGLQSSSTLEYRVGFASGTIQSPVAPNDNPLATNLSSFKIKSTIPVKFKLYNDAAMTQLMTTPPAGSTARIVFEKYDSSTDTIDQTDLVTGNANTDNIYRWTGATDFQYIYNLSTTGRQAGTYRVNLTLYASDNTTILAQSAWQYFVLRN
jgi:hypothetical protein